MKVILFKNIETLGKQGDIVSVASGYFRNYLAPRQMASEATPSNLKRLEAKRRILERQVATEVDAAKLKAADMEKVVLTFPMKAGEKDQLFGSVTNAEIAEKLAEAGFEIDRRHIKLDEPIKALGMFTVHIRLHHEVTAHVKVLVEKGL